MGTGPSDNSPRFNTFSGGPTGLPNEPRQLLQGSDISSTEPEKNPGTAKDTGKLSQQRGAAVSDNIGDAFEGSPPVLVVQESPPLAVHVPPSERLPGTTPTTRSTPYNTSALPFSLVNFEPLTRVHTPPGYTPLPCLDLTLQRAHRAHLIGTPSAPNNH